MTRNISLSEDALLSVLSSEPHLRLYKPLLKLYGPEAAVFLSNLIDKYCYFKSKELLEEDDWFFLTYEQQTEQTGMSSYVLRRCKSTLQEAGILKSRKQGMPRKEWYYIDASRIAEILDDHSLKNTTPSGKETSSLAVKKLNCLRLRNLTNINNIDIINNKENKKKGEASEKPDALPSSLSWKSLSEKYSSPMVQFTRWFLLVQQERHPQFIKNVSPDDSRVLSSLSGLDKLCRIDGYDFDAQVRPVLECVPDDSFWSRNLLSLGSLRGKSKNGEIKFVNICNTLRRGEMPEILPAPALSSTLMRRCVEPAIRILSDGGDTEPLMRNIADTCDWFARKQKRPSADRLQEYFRSDAMQGVYFRWQAAPDAVQLLEQYVAWLERQDWLRQITPALFRHDHKIFRQFLHFAQREIYFFDIFTADALRRADG